METPIPICPTRRSDDHLDKSQNSGPLLALTDASLSVRICSACVLSRGLTIGFPVRMLNPTPVPAKPPRWQTPDTRSCSSATGAAQIQAPQVRFSGSKLFGDWLRFQLRSPPLPCIHLFCPFSSKQLYSPRTQHSRAGVISPEHVKHSLRFFFSFLLFPILFHPLVWRTLSSPPIFTHQSSHFSLPSLCFLTSFFRAETNK